MTRRPFLEELAEVARIVWIGDPANAHLDGPNGVRETLCVVRAELRELVAGWKAGRS